MVMAAKKPISENIMQFSTKTNKNSADNCNWAPNNPAKSNDTVQILSTVEMRNLANNMVMKYTIVSESEANLREGKISSTTPIAQGLLSKKAGDVVEIKIPQGIIKLEILKISID